MGNEEVADAGGEAGEGAGAGTAVSGEDEGAADDKVGVSEEASATVR